MAWYLNVDRAANRHALIPTPLTVAYGTDAYVLDFTVAYTDATTDQIILGSVSVTSVHAIYFTTSGRLQITVGNTNAYFTNGSFGLPDGDFHNYRLEHDSGGAWRAYRDGVLFQSGTYSGALTTTSPLNAIFKRSSNTILAVLSANLRFKHLEAIGFGAGSDKWNANLFGGVDGPLPSVSGTNNATLVAFPAGNSHLVYYDLDNAKVGLGWGGTQDYSTLRAWYDARKTATVFQTALCSGNLGSSFVTIGTTDFTAGASILGQVQYTGANHAALSALDARLIISATSAVTAVRDLYVTNPNTGQAALSIDGTNVVVERCYAYQTVNPGSNSATLMTSGGATAKNCVVVNTLTTATKVVRPSSTGIIQNCIAVGGNYAIQSEWTNSRTEKCYAVNGTTNSYSWPNGRPAANVTNASSDASGDTGYQNLAAVDNFVDFANGDYRIKNTSALHAAGIGAFFEPTSADQVVISVNAEQLARGVRQSVVSNAVAVALAAEGKSRAVVDIVESAQVIAAVLARQNSRAQQLAVTVNQNSAAVPAVQRGRGAVQAVRVGQAVSAVPGAQLVAGAVNVVTVQQMPSAVPGVQVGTGMVAGVTAQQIPSTVPAVQPSKAAVTSVSVNQAVSGIPAVQVGRGVVQEVIVEEAGSQVPTAIPARQTGRGARRSVVTVQSPNSLPAVQMTYGVRDTVAISQAVSSTPAVQVGRGVVQTVDVETGGTQEVVAVPAVQMSYGVPAAAVVDQTVAAVPARQVSRGRSVESEPIIIDPMLISFTPLASGFTLNTVLNSFQLQQLR